MHKTRALDIQDKTCPMPQSFESKIDLKEVSTFIVLRRGLALGSGEAQIQSK